jgi:hypothetical protein
VVDITGVRWRNDRVEGHTRFSGKFWQIFSEFSHFQKNLLFFKVVFCAIILS